MKRLVKQANLVLLRANVQGQHVVVKRNPHEEYAPTVPFSWNVHTVNHDRKCVGFGFRLWYIHILTGTSDYQLRT